MWKAIVIGTVRRTERISAAAARYALVGGRPCYARWSITRGRRRYARASERTFSNVLLMSLAFIAYYRRLIKLLHRRSRRLSYKMFTAAFLHDVQSGVVSIARISNACVHFVGTWQIIVHMPPSCWLYDARKNRNWFHWGWYRTWLTQ